MKPLSEALTDLISLSEEMITRPRSWMTASTTSNFAALAAEIRRVDALPAEGERATRAGLVMVVAIEAFFAGDREPTSQWLGLMGTTLPILRGEAWRARQNERAGT